MGQLLARLVTFLPAHRLCGSKFVVGGLACPRYSVADGNNGGRTGCFRPLVSDRGGLMALGVRVRFSRTCRLTCSQLNKSIPASSSSATSLRCCRRRQARLALGCILSDSNPRDISTLWESSTANRDGQTRSRPNRDRPRPTDFGPNRDRWLM
jgi:hypothetical protein